MTVYNACVNSTLLDGSEAWTTYARQERHLNTFHILGIAWQEKVPNIEVLSRSGYPSMFTLLRQRKTPLVGPRPSHARRSHPQKPVWRAGRWKETNWAATAAVPQCRETRHESCGHQQGVLGEPGSHTIRMERNPDQTLQVRGGEADTSRHGIAGPQKAK